MPGLMEIRIGMDPNIVEVGGRVLTWHGFLTFLAVAMAVFIIARWARKEGISTDAVYSVAVWAIIGGIIGSRLLHVVDRWTDMIRQRNGVRNFTPEKVLWAPVAVKVDEQGRVLIADTTRHRIQIYQKNKEPVLI